MVPNVHGFPVRGLPCPASSGAAAVNRCRLLDASRSRAGNPVDLAVHAGLCSADPEVRHAETCPWCPDRLPRRDFSRVRLRRYVPDEAPTCRRTRW